MLHLSKHIFTKLGIIYDYYLFYCFINYQSCNTCKKKYKTKNVDVPIFRVHHMLGQLKYMVVIWPMSQN